MSIPHHTQQLTHIDTFADTSIDPINHTSLSHFFTWQVTRVSYIHSHLLSLSPSTLPYPTLPFALSSGDSHQERHKDPSRLPHVRQGEGPERGVAPEETTHLYHSERWSRHSFHDHSLTHNASVYSNLLSFYITR